MADNGINSLHFFIINKTFEFINRTGMESSIVVKEFLISFGSLMFLTVGSQWSELYEKEMTDINGFVLFDRFTFLEVLIVVKYYTFIRSVQSIQQDSDSMC